MSKINKNNLEYLGTEFQYRLIKACIEDAGFFRDLNGVIDQNMFTETYLRTIVGVMKEYYTKQESVPSYKLIEIEIRQKITDEDEIQYYTEALDKIQKTTTEGYKEIEDMAERFFFQQNLMKVSNEIKMMAGGGDLAKYEACKKLLEDALAVGRKNDNTSTPFQSIDDDLSPESVVTIPTGINKLDASLGGGIDKGKVGLIICPMGCGKTSMTTCLAANAARYKCKQNDFEGYKVLQICFEDMPRDLHRKYIANVTGVEARNLNESVSTTEAVKKQLRESPDFNLLNNNIQILNLFTGEETATSIKNKIKKKINEGFKPDVVIIDYFECIECEPGYSKSDVTEREGRTMRKFENMAKELDLALWIPTQGNRESISAELVTNDKVGGSIRKNQIAQVVLSITRSVDDVRNKRATLSILKNRTGEAGLTLNGVFFDNGTCTINTDDVIEFDDAFGYNEHVHDVETKQRTSMIQDARKAYKK
jgi:replicative DNA helicase